MRSAMRESLQSTKILDGINPVNPVKFSVLLMLQQETPPFVSNSRSGAISLSYFVHRFIEVL
jgi:hypothetical protein